MDDQMTFITIELDKFTKGLAEIENDLDKLIYTMKMLHETTDPTQFPAFWDEEWLQAAIKELDTRAMTPEKRMAYEMTLSANALAIENENRKIQEARQEAKETENLAVKTEVITKALKRGKLTLEEIAEDNSVGVDFVLAIQRNLNQNS